MSATSTNRTATPLSRTTQEQGTYPSEMTCEVCGNAYDKAFQVVIHGRTHTFDCFECAIQMLAPLCKHCGCRIIGHGVEESGHFYCCAHCAHHDGAEQIIDRA
jgi:transposase